MHHCEAGRTSIDEAAGLNTNYKRGVYIIPLKILGNSKGLKKARIVIHSMITNYKAYLSGTIQAGGVAHNNWKVLKVKSCMTL